jgi:hypothetical protein
MSEAKSREDLLTEWSAAKASADSAVESERALRAQVFAAYFPSPKYGSNSVELGKGYTLKAQYPLKREIDEVLLDAMKRASVAELSTEMRSKAGIAGDMWEPCPSVLQAVRINIDALVRYSPELSGKAYNVLTAEQKAIADCFITSKPGSISLSIEAPKETK